MTLSGDAFALIKKIFLVSEELTRLSSEVRELSRESTNHEVRLAVIETKLEISHRSSHRKSKLLPGS